MTTLNCRQQNTSNQSGEKTLCCLTAHMAVCRDPYMRRSRVCREQHITATGRTQEAEANQHRALRLPVLSASSLCTTLISVNVNGPHLPSLQCKQNKITMLYTIQMTFANLHKKFEIFDSIFFHKGLQDSLQTF